MLQLVKLLTVLPALGLALAEQVPLTHTLAQANADLDALLAADPQLKSDTGVDWPTDEWSGLVTFGHAQPARCWGADKKLPFDIAVIGTSALCISARFVEDGAIFGRRTIRYRYQLSARVSYPPTVTAVCVSLLARSRFGPNGIRQGSRRVWLETLNVPWKTIVTNGSNVVDCGDVRESLFCSRVHSI
jgi:agmatinase